MRENLVPTELGNRDRLKLRLLASKLAHVRRAKKLEAEADGKPLAVRMPMDRQRLEHLEQANFIATQIDKLTAN